MLKEKPFAGAFGKKKTTIAKLNPSPSRSSSRGSSSSSSGGSSSSR